MMHAQIVQGLARAAPAAPPLAMTPPAYLKLRRKAAGLSVERVAEILAPRARDRSEIVALVRMLETEGVRARHRSALILLRSAFRFDMAVYEQLATEPADRHPRICTGCGCTEWDPCESTAGMCAWHDPVTCTVCITAPHVALS